MIKQDKLLDAVHYVASWIQQAPLHLREYLIAQEGAGYTVRGLDGRVMKRWENGFIPSIDVAAWFLTGEAKVSIDDAYRAIEAEKQAYLMYVPILSRTMQIVPYPYSPSLEVQAERMRDTWEEIRREQEKYRLVKEEEAAANARKQEAKDFLARMKKGELQAG